MPGVTANQYFVWAVWIEADRRIKSANRHIRSLSRRRNTILISGKVCLLRRDNVLRLQYSTLVVVNKELCYANEDQSQSKASGDPMGRFKIPETLIRGLLSLI